MHPEAVQLRLPQRVVEQHAGAGHGGARAVAAGAVTAQAMPSASTTETCAVEAGRRQPCGAVLRHDGEQLLAGRRRSWALVEVRLPVPQHRALHLDWASGSAPAVAEVRSRSIVASTGPPIAGGGFVDSVQRPGAPADPDGPAPGTTAGPRR